MTSNRIPYSYWIFYFSLMKIFFSLLFFSLFSKMFFNFHFASFIFIFQIHEIVVARTWTCNLTTQKKQTTKCVWRGMAETDCQVPFATEAVMQLCHGRRRCTISADTQTFGNPCRPDSRMYLKTVYTCGKFCYTHYYAVVFLFFFSLCFCAWPLTFLVDTNWRPLMEIRFPNLHCTMYMVPVLW